MDITNKAYDGIKQGYRFSEWPRAAAARQGAVRSFLPQLPARPALTLESRVPRTDARGAFSEHYVNPADPGVRVLVDIAVHPSVAAAHDALLHILAMVSAPILPSAAERGLAVGDVAFTGHGDSLLAVLFVRRNVVVDIRSVGNTPVVVAELARALDAQIQSLPRVD